MEFTLDEKNLQEKSDSVSKMVPLGPIGATGTEASQVSGDFPQTVDFICLRLRNALLMKNLRVESCGSCNRQAVARLIECNRIVYCNW
jgi:hypothetical protein